MCENPWQKNLQEFNYYGSPRSNRNNWKMYHKTQAILPQVLMIYSNFIAYVIPNEAS